jgi:hypothetical protein
MLTWANLTLRERELLQDFADNPISNDSRYTDAKRLLNAGLVLCDKSPINYTYTLTFIGQMMLAINKNNSPSGD